MKEQIEEMALDLCDKKTKVAIVIVSIDDEGKPRLARSAHYLKNLIEAGYRKQKEGEWKHKLTHSRCIPVSCNIICDQCCNSFYRFVGMNYKYCPNCGAKMKGGAE